MFALAMPSGAQAAGGDLLWDDRVDDAEANAVVAQGDRVYVVGEAQNDDGNDDVDVAAIGSGKVIVGGEVDSAAGDIDGLVRAHKTNNGQLRWEDQVDVFVAGSVEDENGEEDWLVRAYDARWSLVSPGPVEPARSLAAPVRAVPSRLPLRAAWPAPAAGPGRRA